MNPSLPPGMGLERPKISITMGPEGPMLKSNTTHEMCMLLLSTILAELVAQHVGAKPRSDRPSIMVPGGH